MALFGLRVSTAGGPVPLWRGVPRAAIVWIGIMLAGYLNGVAAPLTLVVLLSTTIGPMFIRRDRRGAHDLVTGTFVSKRV
jgi:uncharacterized RDD family membrane protein YckC